MRFFRGTFRASVLAAILTLLVGSYQSYLVGEENSNSARHIWTTLKCGERFLNKNMSKFTNAYGLVDIGAAGCSSKQFLSTFDEIRESLRKPEPSAAAFRDGFWLAFRSWAFKSFIVFLGVNLAGLLLFAAFRSFKWVAAGFRNQ